jgi:hypothetical protein
MAEVLRRSATWIGVVVALVGGLHLVGWLTGLMAQRGQSAITMKTNTAVCLLLLGTALALVTRRAGQIRRFLAGALAASALVIGVLTLSENIVGWDLGIDQILAEEPPGALGVLSPNRMGTPASVAVPLAATSLLILSLGRERAVPAAQGLALLVSAIGLVPTIGHIYGAPMLYGLARRTAIAWPTSLCLVALAVGLLCARPMEGVMAQFTRKDPSGANLRRLLLPTIMLPIMAGWMRLTGEKLGWFDTSLGTAILIVGFILSFSLLAYVGSLRVSEGIAALQQSRLSAERAKAAAEDASRAKDHFIAVLSHELRTPLTPVLTGVDLLEAEGGLSQRAKGLLAIIRRNVEMEALLIDGLLDVTRIARGKVELDRSRIELSSILERAVEVCRPDLEARRLHFGVDFGPRPYVMDADPARLQQAFWNLLKNAAKFTPPGGCVGVRCRPEHGQVVVDVEDSGRHDRGAERGTGEWRELHGPPADRLFRGGRNGTERSAGRKGGRRASARRPPAHTAGRGSRGLGGDGREPAEPRRVRSANGSRRRDRARDSREGQVRPPAQRSRSAGPQRSRPHTGPARSRRASAGDRHERVRPGTRHRALAVGRIPGAPGEAGRAPAADRRDREGRGPHAGPRPSGSRPEALVATHFVVVVGRCARLVGSAGTPALAQGASACPAHLRGRWGEPLRRECLQSASFSLRPTHSRVKLPAPWGGS